MKAPGPAGTVRDGRAAMRDMRIIAERMIKNGARLPEVVYV